MKNLIKKIIIFMLILMFSITICYGSETGEYIRVRIRTPRQHNEQAELDGYSNIYVYEIRGTTVNEIFQTDREISVLMDSYYDKNYNFLNDGSEASIGPYHVKIKGKEYSTYEEAKNEIDNISQTAGSGFYAHYDGDKYQIYIGTFKDEKSAEYIFSKLNQNGLDGEVVNGNKKNVIIYDDANEIVFSYSNNYGIYFSSKNSQESCNMIKIDSKPYRGMIGFNIINDSTLISLNHVDIESYLYGVVPCESSASWPIEALKAQALAARTYALSNLNPNAYNGYDVEDSIVDQVYGGYSSEYPSTNKAVEETRGEKIYYEGKLIEAVFHSTSGGSTEDSENIWGNEVPYLRGVEDEYSNISPITEWQQTYTKDYIINRLKLYGNNVNELYSIKITKVSDHNRVLECIFDTDKGKITYTKDKVRSVLGLKSLWFTIGNSSGIINYDFNFIYSDDSAEVPSRGSVIDSITDSEVKTSGSLKASYMISKNNETSKIEKDNVAFISSSGVSINNNGSTSASGSEYSFNGRGWGHSLGLSQYGAKDMASKGFTCDEIIKHYYTGVTIK